MLVRKYLDKDFDNISNLFKESFDIQTPKQNSKQILDNLLQSNMYIVYIVEDNNEFCGACVVYIHSDPFDKDFATLWYFAVVKHKQGKGYGSYLLREVKNDLATKNLDCLILTTSPTNFACQNASTKAGYTQRLSYRVVFDKKQ